MKRKYTVLVGDSVVSIYEQPKYGLVVVFHNPTLEDIEGAFMAHDENACDVEGEELEKLKELIFSCIPVFNWVAE